MAQTDVDCMKAETLLGTFLFDIFSGLGAINISLLFAACF